MHTEVRELPINASARELRHARCASLLINKRASNVRSLNACHFFVKPCRNQAKPNQPWTCHASISHGTARRQPRIILNLHEPWSVKGRPSVPTCRGPDREMGPCSRSCSKHHNNGRHENHGEVERSLSSWVRGEKHLLSSIRCSGATP